MEHKDKKSGLEERKSKIRSSLYNVSFIKSLERKLGLSEEIVDASVLIYRLYVGLGKGLSSSQKRSFSAAAVWHANKLVDESELPKEDLAEAVDISSRTLARRFRDLEEDEDSKRILNFVKHSVPMPQSTLSLFK